MHRIHLLTAAAVLGLGAGRAAAAPFHDDTHRYAVELPKGWEAMTARELKMVNALSQRELLGLDVEFVAGFRPAGGEMGSTPFVLVQVDKEFPPGQSFADFEKAFARDVAAADENDREATLRLAHRLAFGKPVFDRERQRYTIRGRGARDTGRHAGMLVAGYPGADKLVILHGFAPDGAYRAHEQTLAKLIDSFKFDEAEKVEADTRPAWQKMFLTPTGGVATPGLVGGGVVLVVGVLGWVVLSRRPPARGPQWG